VFGNVESFKLVRLEELHAVDKLEEERGLDSEDLLKRNSIASDLKRIILQEEISWRQKSKLLWLKAGDKCTKFFHHITNSNIRSNSIESLYVNRSITSDHPTIRDHIVQFYEFLFF
jgi:hypothetical protein